MAGFKVAQKVVKDLQSDQSDISKAAFERSQIELAIIFMDIAEELTKEIRQHPDQALGEQARQAMGLMEDYIPPEARPTERVAQVTAMLTASEHEVSRNSGLDNAVVEIGEAVAKKNLPHAYELYRTLVTDYPEVIDNERLAKAMQEVSRAQQVLVKTVPSSAVARGRRGKARHSGDGGPGLAAQDRRGAGRPGTDSCGDGPRRGIRHRRGHRQGHLAAAGGQGIESACRRLHAAPHSAEPQSDVILVDAVHQEIWRVEGVSGRVVWRNVIGEPLAGPPVIAGKRVLVATQSGRLVMIELAEGKAAACLQLPQPLAVRRHTIPSDRWSFRSQSSRISTSFPSRTTVAAR